MLFGVQDVQCRTWAKVIDSAYDQKELPQYSEFAVWIGRRSCYTLLGFICVIEGRFPGASKAPAESGPFKPPLIR